MAILLNLVNCECHRGLPFEARNCLEHERKAKIQHRTQLGAIDSLLSRMRYNRPNIKNISINAGPYCIHFLDFYTDIRGGDRGVPRLRISSASHRIRGHV